MPLQSYLLTKALMHPEHLEKIMPLVVRRKFEKGQILLSKGDLCKHTFFVEKGLLRFYSLDEAGKEHIVQFGCEDWFVSDRGSAYFNQASNYYIDAIEDSEVAMLDINFIEKASEISPEFRTYNEYLLQNHIRQLQNRINLLIGASAEARYLEFIKLYPNLTLRVPQWMIASYLGITPESLSRVRKELAKRNFRPESKS